MNTNEIILSQKINDFLEKIGFNGKNQKVLNYFLHQNIKAVFGKNTFLPHEIEMMIRVTEVSDFTKKPYENGKEYSLYILYNQKEYQICSNIPKTALEMFLQDGRKIFSIKEYENIIMNSFMTYSDAVTTKLQVVGIGKKSFFDYKEIVKKGNEELSYSAKRLTPIGAKFKNKEIFNLEYLDMTDFKQQTEEWNPNKKSVYEKLQNLKHSLQNLRNEKVVGIVTSYELTDLYDFLPQIYEILETENIDSMTRKKIKR